MKIEENMRQFTIGKLELRTLAARDILWLSALVTCTIIHVFLKAYCPCKDFQFLFFTTSITGFQTITSPLGVRFRSIYFSIIWLLCCLLLIDTSFWISLFPLCTFVLHHIFRYIFYLKYKQEFIPYFMGKGGVWSHYSKIEKRRGNKKDKTFSYIKLFLGILIFFMLLFLFEFHAKDLPCGICT
jgi:hypothetical protein